MLKPVPGEKCEGLIQAVDEFMHITARDVLEGLDMDQPRKAVQLPFATLFGWVFKSASW